MFELLIVAGVAVVFLGVCGKAGAYVAKQKGRKGSEGAWFGVLLGPLGCLIVAMLPNVERPRKRRFAERKPLPRDEDVPLPDWMDRPAPGTFPTSECRRD